MQKSHNLRKQLHSLRNRSSFRKDSGPERVKGSVDQRQTYGRLGQRCFVRRARGLVRPTIDAESSSCALPCLDRRSPRLAFWGSHLYNTRSCFKPGTPPRTSFCVVFEKCRAGMTTSAFAAMDGSWLLATKAEMRRELIDEICSTNFFTDVGADIAGTHTNPSDVIAKKIAELRDILPLSLERNIYVAEELSRYMATRPPEDRCAFTMNALIQPTCIFCCSN